MSAPDSTVTIPNPEDPFGPPLYEGPVDDAHQHLIPGVYEVSPEGAMTDSWYSLLVSHDSSSLLALGEMSESHSSDAAARFFYDAQLRLEELDSDAATTLASEVTEIHLPSEMSGPDILNGEDRLEPGQSVAEQGLADELAPTITRSVATRREISVDARFGAESVTVRRISSDGAPTYRFVGRDPEVALDTNALGVIAAGDRAPRPDRASIYAELGERVRDHLIGVTDAIADHKDAVSGVRATSLSPHVARTASRSL